MRKVALLKRRFNKAKRRVSLGQGKPDDVYLMERIAKELGYKDQMKPAQLK